MTRYLKVELDANGITPLKGQFEVVTDRDSASGFTDADAGYFQRRASDEWTDFIWTVKSVGEHKFLVKGEPKKPK